ncbi:MAG: VWA domain-containing protein [Oscillospiraceae bacterium]|nr:VWA domain-containing protein [Oscillospiraceae bacterium]
MKKLYGMKRAAALCAAVMTMSAITPMAIAAEELPEGLSGSESVYSLTAETAEQGVFLKWEAVEDAVDYVIYRARCDENGIAANKPEKIAVTRSTEYTDRTARGDKDKLYVYKIAPRFKESGAPVQGEYSEEVYAYAGIVFRAPGEYDDIEVGEAAVEAGAGTLDEADYDEEDCDYDYDESYDDEIAPGAPPLEDDSEVIGEYENSITAGTLTAGEWRDNENFAEYVELMRTDKWQAEYDFFKIKSSRRHTVVVTDSNGEYVQNALVTLKSGSRILGQARTNNKGVAYVFYNIYGRRETPSVMEITAGSERRRIRISQKDTCLKFNVQLKGEYKAPEKALDLMFMIDTTGSMGDELEYLQAEFLDVIKRVDSDNPGLDKQVSMNFYRDEGDDYVIRPFAFTTDMQKASEQLSAQKAYGGGNYPEAVDIALENAINGHKWREDSTKIMFMVLDAPAHSSEEITRSLVKSAKAASAKGIRIIPIVSSGAEFDVEYLMRSMAVISGGTYVFLTDESGVGYSHLAPTISEEPEDEKLNELMIRLIDEYLE